MHRSSLHRSRPILASPVLIRLVFAGLALLALLPAAAQVPSFDFSASAEGLSGPDTLPAGLVTVHFTNDDTAPHMLLLAKLNEGTTLESLQSDPEAAFGPGVTLAGGFGPTMPGQSAAITFDLAEAGDYVALDMMSGSSLPITVEAANAQPERPEADLKIEMLDFAFAMPEELRAGEQTWEVLNAGAEPHEMIVFKLNEGVSAEDLMAAMEADPEGEPPAAMVGGAMPMGVGYANFVTMNLEAGNYVAICFIPSGAHEGAPHFALGMIRPFTVTESAAQN